MITITKLLSLIHYVPGEEKLLFFRGKRTQRRHLTVGGVRRVKTLIVFPFITDKKLFLNCWEVHGGNAGLYQEEGRHGMGVKSILQLGLR